MVKLRGEGGGAALLGQNRVDWESGWVVRLVVALPFLNCPSPKTIEMVSIVFLLGRLQTVQSERH